MNNKYGTKKNKFSKQQSTNTAMPLLKETAIYNDDMTEVVMNPPYNKTEWAKLFDEMKSNKKVEKITIIHPTNQLENYFLSKDSRPEIVKYLKDGVNDIKPLPWYMFPDVIPSCGNVAISTWYRNKLRKNPLSFVDRYDLRFQCRDKDLYRKLEKNIIPNLKLDNKMFTLKKCKWGSMPKYWVFLPLVNNVHNSFISPNHLCVYNGDDEIFIENLRKSNEYKECLSIVPCVTGDKEDLKKFIDFWNSDFGFVLKKVYVHDVNNYVGFNRTPKFDVYQDIPNDSRYIAEAEWINGGYEKWLKQNTGLKFNDYRHLTPELQKKLGAVYTPEDFSKFMKCVQIATQIDPQCGTGNLLLMMLKQKLDYGIIPIEALKTIRGTDINANSIIHCRENVLKFLNLENNDEAIKYVNDYIVCTDSKDWDYDNWKPAGLSEFLS